MYSPPQVYAVSQGRFLNLQQYYVHLAQQLYTRCEGHKNPEIAALGNYEHEYYIIGRRQNQYLRNFSLQIPGDF